MLSDKACSLWMKRRPLIPEFNPQEILHYSSLESTNGPRFPQAVYTNLCTVLQRPCAANYTLGHTHGPSPANLKFKDLCFLVDVGPCTDELVSS